MPSLFPARLPLSGLLLCPVCRRDWSGSGGCCLNCEETLSRGLDLPGLVALGYYRGGLARAVRAYKYGQVRNLARSLSTQLAARVERRDWRPGMVTHVPLNPSRKRQRGFDQAALLARHLAGALGLPWRPLLERARATPQQARLTADARRRNVHGAFSARGPVNGVILLVDDVFTTGATLGECREVLERAGAEAVLLSVITVAGQNRGSAGAAGSKDREASVAPAVDTRAIAAGSREARSPQRETPTPLVIPRSAPTRTWG